MATATASSLTSNQIFDLIRTQAAIFPFPAPSLTVTVGTFDAATGKFTYAVNTYQEDFVDPKGKPVVLTGGHVDALNVANIFLEFKVKNRQGDFVASVSGTQPVRTSNSDSVVVPIGAAASVAFTLSCAARSSRARISWRSTI